jgi:hypothetical protein
METHQRILTQRDMQDARTRADFCYLCGGPFSHPGTKRRSRTVSAEHVLPRSLYPEPPAETKQRWCIVMDAHSACDQRDKQAGDDELRTLHRFMASSDTGEQVRPGALRRLNLTPVILTMSGQALPGLDGIARQMEYAWRWIRGLHAALYCTPLPRNATHSVLPPVPSADAHTARDVGRLSHAARGVVAAAEQMNMWDGIECWGGQVRYHCTWTEKLGQVAHDRWFCAWTLVFQAALQWSAGVMPPGAEFGWHGTYALPSLPTGAAVLSARPGSNTHP